MVSVCVSVLQKRKARVESALIHACCDVIRFRNVIIGIDFLDMIMNVMRVQCRRYIMTFDIDIYII